MLVVKYKQIIALTGAFAAAALIAACGGGGGGGAINNPGGGGNPSPSPSPSSAGSPSPSPSPSASPQLTGSMQIATGGTVGTGFTYTAAGNAQVVFSCGCTAQAGTATADVSGNYTLVANSTPTPSAPDPTYTIVPGRNYIIVAQSSAGQAWTMQFAGAIPAHNLSLSGASPSDVYTAAASLYVYQNSTAGTFAFDLWNYNTVSAWLTTLHGSPNAQETALLNDIATQSGLHRSLFPSAPTWNPTQSVNGTIQADLAAVKASADATKPTPCPSGACTGTPTP